MTKPKEKQSSAVYAFGNNKAKNITTTKVELKRKSK